MLLEAWKLMSFARMSALRGPSPRGPPSTGLHVAIGRCHWSHKIPKPASMLRHLTALSTAFSSYSRGERDALVSALLSERIKEQLIVWPLGQDTGSQTVVFSALVSSAPYSSRPNPSYPFLILLNIPCVLPQYLSLHCSARRPCPSSGLSEVCLSLTVLCSSASWNSPLFFLAPEGSPPRSMRV